MKNLSKHCIIIATNVVFDSEEKKIEIQFKMSENLKQENIKKRPSPSDGESTDEDDETCMEKLMKNVKIHEDLSTIRDCFGSRNEIEKQALASLTEGMMKICTEKL